MLKFLDTYFCVKFDESRLFRKALMGAFGIGGFMFLISACAVDDDLAFKVLLVWVGVIASIFVVTFLGEWIPVVFKAACDEIRERAKKRVTKSACFNEKNEYAYLIYTKA